MDPHRMAWQTLIGSFCNLSKDAIIDYNVLLQTSIITLSLTLRGNCQVQSRRSTLAKFVSFGDALQVATAHNSAAPETCQSAHGTPVPTINHTEFPTSIALLIAEKWG